MKKNKNNFVSLGVKNLVGIGLIGATAGMVNTLPSGTAKDIAGIVPGLQSVSLVSENAKFLNTKFPKTKSKGVKKK